jgi:HEAT repeat protein
MAAGPAAAPVNAAVPELVALLEDPRRETVRAAARKLLEKGTKEAVVAAARAVDLRDLGFKFEAPARLVPWIVELLGDPEDEVRGRAIGALSALGAREAVAPRVERLGGRDSIEILAALGELEAREAIPKMTPFLAHRRWAFRWQAAETLGRLRAQEAEAGLIRLLDDPTQDVRQTAALALGELGSARAVPKLLEMLVDENAPAGAALCLLGRPEGVPVVLSTAEEAVRLRTNRMFRSSTHRPSLLFALNALRSPELRRRLDAKKLEGPPAENFYELGRRVAADAGLEFESQGEDQVHLGEIDRLRGCTLWSGPFWVMAGGFGRGDHLEAILDEGKLRLVEHDDALRFWKAWHEKK